MTKDKAQQLIESIRQLKDLKAMLMRWSNADGYSLDFMVESYLQGILNAE